MIGQPMQDSDGMPDTEPREYKPEPHAEGHTGQIVGSTWGEFQQLIMFRLEANTNEIHNCREDVAQLRKEVTEGNASMRVDIAMLQVRSGVWGLIGGMVPVVTALLVWLLTTGVHK